MESDQERVYNRIPVMLALVPVGLGLAAVSSRIQNTSFVPAAAAALLGVFAGCWLASAIWRLIVRELRIDGLFAAIMAMAAGVAIALAVFEFTQHTPDYVQGLAALLFGSTFIAATTYMYFVLPVSARQYFGR